MIPEEFSEEFIKKLLVVLPFWHSKIVRPFKEILEGKMSLETYYCLETLKQRGPSTMTELAAALKVPKQQVTKLAGKLYEFRFVERVYDESDRRLIRIRLTETADAYIADYYKKNADFARHLERLSKEDLLRLDQAVTLLADVLPRLK